MAIKTTPDGLAAEISKALADYTKEVTEAIEKETEKSGKELLEEVRKNAPVRTGKYKKGFRIKKENKKGEVNRIVYNAAKPGLVHLLELGHAKRGGGRVAGIPHMAPALEKVETQYLKNIQKIIEKGG